MKNYRLVLLRKTEKETGEISFFCWSDMKGPLDSLIQYIPTVVEVYNRNNLSIEHKSSEGYWMEIVTQKIFFDDIVSKIKAIFRGSDLVVIIESFDCSKNFTTQSRFY